MHLLIMRHGEAQAYTGAASDSYRALTHSGESQAAIAGAKIAQYCQPDRILVSPFKRTRQTASLVVDQFPEAISLEEKDWLVPDMPVDKAVFELKRVQAKNVLVVSHMPLVSLLTQYFSSQNLGFGTGSVAKISFLQSNLDASSQNEFAQGQGEFSWLV